jgi:tetratricopeptide (TPR) repeat protein
MKQFIKKIYLVLFFVIILSNFTKVLAKDNKNYYSSETISNYFSGTISFNNYNTEKAYEYLEKIEKVKINHNNYNIKYIHTLILEKKFNQAFDFAKSLKEKNVSFFEVDLLMGLNSFIKEDYNQAQKHFLNLNKIYKRNPIYKNFLGNALLSWTHAEQNNKEESLDYHDKINQQYYELKKIQNVFLQCYFDTPKVELNFQELINDKDYIFSRYNFFLANYLLHKNKDKKAKEIISRSSEFYNSNVLLKQAENFILSGDVNKIKKFFTCKNSKDNIAEIFYILANLSSLQKDYQISNFYLNISLFFNNKFTPNKALLAENFFYQKKYKASEKVYNTLKSIGPIYSWYASKSVTTILSNLGDIESSVLNLEKEFQLLASRNFKNYYEMANLYNDNKYYKKAIKYYSIALEKIDEDHLLFPKILYRRGTCYERSDNWDKAESDLKKSLKILPNQPYVLNYLAYSWAEKKINIEAALEMLNLASELEKDNGYILDSLGWAYYVNKDYIKAEYFLRRAVELMPLESVINDHYADSLWQLNKHIQARYFWEQVLDLNEIEKDLKENITKKLVFGITK